MPLSDAMYVYILGGFLGAGKTTLLMKIASRYIASGKKVSVLVNEMGEIGVDGATIRSGGYNAVELPDGCICCTLATTMIEALQDIKNDFRPDVILIEPTGLALPGKVRESVESAQLGEDLLMNIGVVDGPRFEVFLAKRGDFLKEQLGCSDILVLNKMDVTKPEEAVRISEWAKSELGKDVIPVSARNGTNLEKVFAGMRA
jgi:G3E family GTPase